jgi:hypothetical protein
MSIYWVARLFLLVVGCRPKIYLVSANKESEIVDFSSFKTTPRKPAHKNIHIQKLAIVACLESHIM